MISGGHQALFNGMYAVKDDLNVYCTYPLQLQHDEVDSQTNKLQQLFTNVCFVPYINRWPKPKPFRHFVWRILHTLKSLFSKSPAPQNKSPENINYAGWFNAGNSDFFNFIDDVVSKNHIDIVQVELELCNLTNGLAFENNVKTIFVHHELRFVRSNLDTKGLTLSRFAKNSIDLSKTIEIMLLNKYSAVITLSKTDAQKLISEGVKSQVFDSLAIVHTDIKKQIVSDDYHQLVYIGPEYHTPNKIAVEWFLENCWLDILSIDPNYRFKVFGFWSDDTISKITSKYSNVEFLGFVEDLSNALKNSILVVPLSIGSGITMKILEASAFGVPVVSTTIGIEGLPFASGEDCFIADNPEDFIKSILALKDKELRLKFANRAQQIVADNYSIEALRKNRLEIYKSLWQ